MKYFCFFLFFSCNYLFFPPAKTYGQAGNNFNLNIDNGLPSNRIYDIITDKHGYLWIGTPNGIVRYNGYDYKLFNLSNGLPYEDIWEIFEDPKSRLWLCSTSNDIGYIYNNKYHQAYLKDISGTLRPKDIRVSKNGIIFHSPYISGNIQSSICIENNDTISKYIIRSSLFGESEKYDTIQSIQTSFDYHNDINHLASVINDEYGESYVLYNDLVYKIYINTDNIIVKKLYKLNNKFSRIQFIENRNFTIGNTLISYATNTITNSFITLKLSTGETEEIDLRKIGINDSIYYIYPGRIMKINKYFYLFSYKNILKFEYTPTIKLVKSYPIKDLINNADIDGSKIRTFHVDDFWGICIGTITNGIWINYKIPNHFINKNKINFLNYTYVGGKLNDIAFWWNSASTTLASVDNDFNIQYYKLNGIDALYNVVLYNSDTFLLTGNNTYFFINKTGELLKLNKNLIGEGIHSIIIDSPKSSYAIGLSGFFSNKIYGDKVVRNYISKERYQGLVYDSLRHNFWVYNNDKIFIHNKNKDTFIIKENISKLRKQKVEKIAIDNNYGNVFIKCQSSIIMYDYEHNVSQELFRNFNLIQSSIYVYNNTLIVTGRFGIIFCKIKGNQQISEPLVYSNVKNGFYNSIYDYQVSRGKILLSTDKGTYSVNIPNDSEIINNKYDNIIYQYKFILSYKDTIANIKQGDTILINQKDLKLQFDVINPYGNGALKYTYKLSNDSVWHELNANELNLPALSPNNYYKLSLIAHDNAWRSDQLDLYLFIQPYWWQTHTGRRLTWLFAIITVLLLFTTSVLVTRKLVLRATQKRNLQMEMELKSIYAQINPHFIFNTLNSALLLVSKNKMEEAYVHISKFSRLLRGYIKSSRNKLITIAEEINNLKNYMELQQTRFKDKFDYQIIIDKTIKPDNIKIPSLLLQPFVENAINHGILNKQSPGNLKISFNTSEKENEIICIIEDDGIGRKQSKYINENKDNKDESYGDLLIKDLVSIFNKYEHMNIEIKYTDKVAPQTGTIVTIQIKNPHYGQ